VGEPVEVTGSAHLNSETTQSDLCSIIMADQHSNRTQNAASAVCVTARHSNFCHISRLHIVSFTVFWPNFYAHSYALEFN